MRNSSGNDRRALHQRLQLGDAKAGGDPGRAPPTEPDADLDVVDPSLGQKAATLGRRHVASDELEVAEAPAELGQGALHDHRMAVGNVDDEHVDTGPDQVCGPLEVVTLCADGSPDAQPPVSIARREGQPLLLHDVCRGNEAG